MGLEDRDGLDRWLDRALQQYASGEPRPGFEDRIFRKVVRTANCSGTPRVGIGLRWWYRSGAAAALAVGVLLAHWGGNRTSLRTQVPAAVLKLNSRSNTAAGMADKPKPSLPLAPLPQVSEIRSPSPARRLPRRSQIAEEPRLQQFPSPRPLSEQERLLVTCVASHREAAIFMAREQAEFNQQQEQEIERLSSER